MKIKLSYLAFLVWLLSLSVLLTIYIAWLIYPLEIQWLGLEDLIYLPSRTILSNFHILMDYLTNPFNWTLSMPDFPSSRDGLYHFETVKKLFHLAQVIFVLSSLGVCYFWREVIQKGHAKLFSKGLVWLGFLPIVLGLLATVTGFSRFFTLFHQVLFPGDSTWLFNPETDPVIWILPETYFLHCFLLFFFLYETLTWGSYLLLIMPPSKSKSRCETENQVQ